MTFKDWKESFFIEFQTMLVALKVLSKMRYWELDEIKNKQAVHQLSQNISVKKTKQKKPEQFIVKNDTTHSNLQVKTNSSSITNVCYIHTCPSPIPCFLSMPWILLTFLHSFHNLKDGFVVILHNYILSETILHSISFVHFQYFNLKKDKRSLSKKMGVCIFATVVLTLSCEMEEEKRTWMRWRFFIYVEIWDHHEAPLPDKLYNAWDRKRLQNILHI